MHRYIIVIEKAVDNYSAYCSDLPGCIATGSTLEETVERMREAIKFHIEGLKKENMAIPESSSQVTYIEVAT